MQRHQRQCFAWLLPAVVSYPFGWTTSIGQRGILLRVLAQRDEYDHQAYHHDARN
jgi:hypothetical protein